MKAKTYYALLIIFILLIATTFFLLHKYNQAKNEAVKKLQEKGYICEKNAFGIYKNCYKPETKKWPNTLNLTMKINEKNNLT